LSVLAVFFFLAAGYNRHPKQYFNKLITKVGSKDFYEEILEDSIARQSLIFSTSTSPISESYLFKDAL